MDSGAFHHMTSDRNLFENYKTFDEPTPIELGNNTIMHAKGQGSIKMDLKVYNKLINGILTNILYVPELCKNLFSIGKVISRNLTLQFQQDEVIIFKQSQPIMTVTRRNSLYYVNGLAIPPLQVNLTMTSNEVQIWHE